MAGAAPGWFIDQLWPWVSSTHCPSVLALAMLLCSRMEVGAPLPDAPHISGSGLAGNESNSLVHANVNLPSVLSFLSNPDLSPPASNADPTASTPITHGTKGPCEFLHGFLADKVLYTEQLSIQETEFKTSNSCIQSRPTPLPKQLRTSQRH